MPEDKKIVSEEEEESALEKLKKIKNLFDKNAMGFIVGTVHTNSHSQFSIVGKFNKPTLLQLFNNLVMSMHEDLKMPDWVLGNETLGAFYWSIVRNACSEIANKFETLKHQMEADGIIEKVSDEKSEEKSDVDSDSKKLDA